MQNTEIEQKIAASYQKILNKIKTSNDIVIDALVTSMNSDISDLKRDIDELKKNLDKTIQE